MPVSMQFSDRPATPRTLPRSEGSPRSRGANLRSLDALRGLLAIYVVCHHARWLLWVGQPEWIQTAHSIWANAIAYSSSVFRYGHEAVMVFFALSGFFIHFRVAEKLAAGTDARLRTSRFFARRAHRLLPPYLFALFVTVALDAVGRHNFPVLYSAHTGNALLDGLFAHKGYSAQSVVPALCLVPSSLGRDFGTNGPLWSLAFEVMYYLAYPLWCYLRLKSFALAYAVVPGLCLALAFVPAANFLLQVCVCYPIWIAGAALAELSCRGFFKRRRIGLALAALTGAFVLNHFVAVPFAVLSINVILGASAVWCFAVLPKPWSSRRWHRALEFCGIRSYTIYIMHFPILVLISSWAMTTQEGLPHSGWLGIGGALLTLALCFLLFEVCEKHFLHKRLAPAPH
jgi:peptidoglycan/LPS O-acetylase OafA/YrhL